MIILKETSDIQQIKLIPTRGNNVSTLTLRNESTNEVTTYITNGVSTSYYLLISQFFNNLKEGHFYEATFTYFGALRHRDRVFCTNQTIANYTINKDEYIASTDNIIFYE